MTMKVEHINPFIEGVHELFSSMLSVQVTRGAVGATPTERSPGHLVALIGLTGTVRGTLALHYPAETAIAVANRLLGVKIEEMDDSVSDVIAETVSIVAGNAKLKFPTGEGAAIGLGLPTVVRGNSVSVAYPRNAPWLEVPFDSELGSFILRVTFDKAPA